MKKSAPVKKVAVKKSTPAKKVATKKVVAVKKGRHKTTVEELYKKTNDKKPIAKNPGMKDVREFFHSRNMDFTLEIHDHYQNMTASERVEAMHNIENSIS